MRLDRPPRLTIQRTMRGVAATLLMALLLAVSWGPSAAVSMSSAPASNPRVIADWNATAFDVIVTDAGIASAESYLWFAFTHAAVYNAVVGITGRYDLYNWNPRVPKRASPEAAAATAAYRLLVTYFPASEARLDAAFLKSIRGIPDGPAKFRGIQFGERAAARIIRLRTNDGRNAPLEFTVPPGPGVWRPTPTAMAPFALPWLSQLRPLLLSSPSQFRAHHPPFLTSRKYAREFNEVKTIGSKTSKSRTPGQSETALFFSDIGVRFEAGFRDLAARHNMDISDSARLFAAANMSAADAVIAAWDGKFTFGYWRPITAIQRGATDGNSATRADTEWEPFLPTPPYPDYPSGLSAVVGAFSRAVTRVLGTNRIDLNLTSAAAGVTRHYEFAWRLNREVVNARIWSGIHFRTADEVGLGLGKQVANWALDNAFGSSAQVRADAPVVRDSSP